MKYEYIKSKRLAQYYYNYEELCNFVFETSKHNPIAPEDAFQKLVVDNDFFGVSSVEELKKLAYDGWKVGKEDFEKMKNVIFNEVTDQVEIINPSYSTEGNEIDVAKYVENEPECWIRFDSIIKSVEVSSKLIHMVVELGVSGGVSTKVIIQRGASILALIELLELSGFKIKLTVQSTSSNVSWFDETTKYSSLSLLLKDYNDIIDTNRLAFILLHPGFCRAMYFRWVECQYEPEMVWQVSSSFKGYPTDNPVVTGDIRFTRMLGSENSWSTVEGCKERIIEQMEKFGIKIKDKETK